LFGDFERQKKLCRKKEENPQTSTTTTRNRCRRRTGSAEIAQNKRGAGPMIGTRNGQSTEEASRQKPARRNPIGENGPAAEKGERMTAVSLAKIKEQWWWGEARNQRQKAGKKK